MVKEYLGDDKSESTAGFVDSASRVRGRIAVRRLLHEGTTVFVEVLTIR
jgi:hypothetical protein